MNIKKWETEFDDILEYENDGNDFYFKWIDFRDNEITEFFGKWLGVNVMNSPLVRIKAMKGAIFIEAKKPVVLHRLFLGHKEICSFTLPTCQKEEIERQHRDICAACDCDAHNPLKGI